jgi:propanol-preferring alcohol dehydrogenase
MSDIPAFPYRLLWEERSIVSVANLTRADGAAFMRIAGQIELNPVVEPFALADGPAALARLKEGRLHGAAVLVDDSGSP